MHAIIEFLPVPFGFLIARLNRLTKPVLFRYDASLLLCVIAGTFVNWLSNEGMELLTIDLATTFVTTFIFIFIDEKAFFIIHKVCRFEPNNLSPRSFLRAFPR
jgi:hypothetical protein